MRTASHTQFRLALPATTAVSILLALSLLTEVGTRAAEPGAKEAPLKVKEKPATKKDPFAWKTMFDGKTLKGWKVPKFGGDGEVTVKDGTIILGMGDPMTGITWAGELPRDNYEVTLEGKRTKGYDFFCTTTFPVGKDPCSFVVGGWAGTVVGLSCVDWYDASDNITSGFMSFEDNKWYKVRIRVSEKKIECWIDDDQKVDLPRKGHKFSIRDEVDLCRPFGICTWMTEGVVRNVKIRKLKPEEVAAIKVEEF